MKHTSYRIYIETYGCQMNKLDSELVSSILTCAGHEITSDMNTADVILLNTCGVRDNAEQRIHGRIGELQSLRKEHPYLIFGVLGCMAQRLGDKLTSKTVRIVAGPDSYRRLPTMLDEAVSGIAVDQTFDTEETYDRIEPIRHSDRSAWVAVMRGCDNFCTYCIVPYTRGRERSVPLQDVIDEVTQLVDFGYREVTLLGQNVNSYRDGEADFASLLDRVADTGIPWVRFLTSHPKDLTTDILEVMASRGNVCNHLHLPLQSGSNRILDLMNRRYTRERYLGLVDEARKRIPDINLSTDVMFGFPGETDDDFADTIDIMKTVRYDFAFMYRYSEREGTRAVTMDGVVPEKVRIERLKTAIDMQNGIMFDRNRERIGTITKVLIKGPSKDGKGWYGFSEASIPVIVSENGTKLAPGEFTMVRIESSTGATLIGSALK